MMSRWGAFAGFGCLLTVMAIFAVAAERSTVPAERVLEDLKYLTDDEREGRGVGTKGLDDAADFIREQFAASGINVSTIDDGPFQKFEMVSSVKLGNPNSLTLVGPDGKEYPVEMGKGFEVCSFGASGEFSGEVVFAGYGIDAPKDGYSDYEGLDVEGKVVMVMRRNPYQAEAKNPHATPNPLARFADLRAKYREAQQRKAAALIIVNDPYSTREKSEERQRALKQAGDAVIEAAEKFLAVDATAAEEVATARKALAEAVAKRSELQKENVDANDDQLMKFGYAGNGDEANTLPAVHLAQSVANQILGSAVQRSLADLEAEIDADHKPHSIGATGWTIRGQTTIERVKSEIKNVIGVLEGEGPHADETIVIGAHYDHVGRGGANSLAPGSTEVHNGADDNASGTVALLELARRLSSREKPLPRRLVFIAFTAEELGLIGSAHYVNNPVFPLKDTIAMFNMDMVGRLVDDKLTVFGTGTSSRWEPELKPLGEAKKFALTFKPQGLGPSDHSSFYTKKIPVLHFFTGTHPDYHRPTDDWDKVNIDGTLRVVELIEQMIVQTAENPTRPDFVEVKSEPSEARTGSRPYVGTIPDFANQDPGYGISGAAAGSPADKAGMKPGDRIVKLGGDKIESLEDFDLALRKHKPGDEVDFVVTRGGAEVTMKVKLEPPR